MKYRLSGMFALGVLALTAESGCAVSVDYLKTVSAGYTGCTPDQLTITNRTETMWNATCDGKVYLCSGTPPAAGSRAPGQYSCAPAVKPE